MGTDEKTDVAQTMIFEGLEMVRRLEESTTQKGKVGGSYKDEEAVLMNNLAAATSIIEEVNSGDEDFHDACDSSHVDADGSDINDDNRTAGGSEEEDSSYTLDEEMSESTESEMDAEVGKETHLSLQDEAHILGWDSHEEEEQRKLLQKNFRLVKPQNFQDQLFNESGPTLAGMVTKCDQIEEEIGNMMVGGVRNPTRFSDKLIQMLQEDIETNEVGEALEKVKEVREALEETYRSEMLQENESRNEAIDKAFREHNVDPSVWEQDANSSNDSHMAEHNQARKTQGEDDFTESRAEND